MGKLDGRIAIVTGAARGLGRSHAIALARNGADVVVCDLCKDLSAVPYSLATEKELAQTVEMVKATGRRCIGIRADVRDIDQMRHVAKETVNKYGKIDILVSNAGVISYSGVCDMTDEIWDDVIDTNLKGTFNSTRAVIPYMMERKYGRIVAISSSMAQEGIAGAAHFVAASWAIMGFVKSLVREVSDYGINVTGILPSETMTSFFANDVTFKRLRPDLKSPTLNDAVEGLRKYSLVPEVIVDPQDVSNALLFLVSDEARYITGHFVSVDCGRCTMVQAGAT